MTNRRTAPPLRVTERVDYALRAATLLAQNPGTYLTTQAIAEHHHLSPKMLGSVLWNLRTAGLVTSRAGWHGGFQLADAPERTSVQALVVAASADGADLSTAPSTDEPVEPVDPVDRFWHTLDTQVQDHLARVTVADLLVAAGALEPIA